MPAPYVSPERRAVERARVEREIRLLFAVVDAIDAHIGNPPRHAYPFRGRIPCPNCTGKVTYVQLTDIKGAGRCSGPCCVDFAPLREVTGAEICAANQRLGLI